MSSYFNRFKSTEVRGPLLNSANGEEAAFASLEGTLQLGKSVESTITDPETGATAQVWADSGGDIVFKSRARPLPLVVND